MSSWAEVTNSTLWKRDALDFVQVVDFGPDLIKAHEFDHDLFGFLETVKVGVCIILNFMNFLFLYFFFSLLCI